VEDEVQKQQASRTKFPQISQHVHRPSSLKGASLGKATLALLPKLDILAHILTSFPLLIAKHLRLLVMVGVYLSVSSVVRVCRAGFRR